MLMLYRALIAIPTLGLACGMCLAEEQPTLTEEEDIINYTIGYRLGRDYKHQGVELRQDILLKGFEDALAGTGPRVAPEEMRSSLRRLKQRVAAERAASLQENLETAEAFLTENAAKDGVMVLPSGLQYKVLEKGPDTGSKPQQTDKVTVQYRGTLIDGTEFDSSYRRGQPATLAVNGVIAGWTEALQMMQVGDKWQLFIPPKLGYGERGSGSKIPPNSALIFDVELISIN